MEQQTSLALVDASWLDPLVAEIKQIMIEWARDTFLRYRKCGQLILNSGYEKGKWHSEQRQYFLEKLGISQPTFVRMVQLGKMSEDKFIHAMNKFPSFFNWANQKKSLPSNFEYELYNVWRTFKLDWNFGEEHPGRTPHQVIANLLYYYTNENDLVIDPMAGGGTIIDVCKKMNRQCRAFDLIPKRQDIEPIDILKQKLPVQDADFAFVDPPYFNLMEEYPDNDFTKDYQSFLSAIEKSFSKLKEALKPKGKAALFLKPMNENMLSGDWLDLTVDSINIARKLGFKLIKRICVPLSTQQFNPEDVIRAKERKIMLNTLRDVVILEAN